MWVTMKSSLILGLLIVFWRQSEALDKAIDLGRVVDEQSVHWPLAGPFLITKKDRQSSADIPWLALNDFATGEHLSTHLDAPFHLNKNGWKVGDIPLEKLMGPGICIDMRAKVLECAQTTDAGDATLTADDIRNWETRYGKIKKGSIVLVNFGWGQYYGTRKYFYNKNVDDTMSFPGVLEDAVELLAKRGVSGIGVDTPSIDRGASKSFEAHQAFTKHNMFGLENLDLSAYLPARGYNIIAMPMKIREGTGAPARVIAVPKLRKEH